MAEQYVEKIRIDGIDEPVPVRDINALHNDTWLDTIYPIGSLHLRADSVDPGTLFGGSWQLFSKGRTLIGVDPDDELFDSVRNSGGNKDATLPEHSHLCNGSTADAGLHGHTANSNGAHSHGAGNNTYFSRYSGTRSSESVGSIGGSGFLMTQVKAGGSWGGTQRTTSDGAHTHSTNQTGTHKHTFSFTSGNAGNNPTNANLPPYITCYIWERVQ